MAGGRKLSNLLGLLLGLPLGLWGCATDGDGADDIAETELTLEPDEQLCLDWCLSGNASDCASPFAGELCYTRCQNDLTLGAGACEAEHREVLACEAGSQTRTVGYCETLDCLAEYAREDLCRGYCVHLGGIPSGGGSQTECQWGSSCYEHEFEARCTVGQAPQCECYVDEQLAGQCEHPEPIAALECGGDLHVFTTCCGSIFEGVLLP